MTTNNQEVKIYIKNITRENVEDCRKEIEKNGNKEFHSLAFQFKNIPEGWYTVDTAHMFDNQYNLVEGMRVFEWCQRLSNKGLGVFPEGYYISEGLDKLREIQNNRFACGYCGKQTDHGGWCDKCRGSEYLKPENYPLLQLLPISQKRDYSVSIPQEVIDDIQVQQEDARKKRRAKHIEDKRAKLRQEEKDLETKIEAFEWLVENGMDFDNVIYYNHTQTFCFGWRDSIPEGQRDALKAKLSGFPFAFEVK